MASSAIWRVTETAGTELIAFVVVVTLARMLAVEQFGAVTLATSVMTMLQGLLYHGFTEALIQKPEVTEQHHRSVLAANFALAGALIGFGALAAWPLGWLLGRPEFPRIFCALLPSLLFRALTTPMLASLRREMDFRSLALRTLVGVTAGGVVAVVLARNGAGYWALVTQQWSVEVVGFVVLLKASTIKPWRARWHLPTLRELTPVALPVMGAAFISIAARRLDSLALGFFLPDHTVGIYFMVCRLVFAAQMVTQHGLSEVALVVLAGISQDKVRYRRGLLRAMRLMTFVCACAFGLLAVAGPWLAPLVFGPKWVPVAEPLRVLSALSMGGAIVSISGVTLVASGYASAFSRLQVGSAFAQLLAVALCARWGLIAVAWGVGIAQCLSTLPALGMLHRYYALTWSSLLAEIMPILILFVVGMFGAEWLTTRGDAWYVQPAASAAFIALMAVCALYLWRKERAERARLSAAGAA